MQEIHYFQVYCKGGHVKTGYYYPMVLPIAAESKSEAARIARTTPRVKHDHKDAILGVEKISYEEFLSILEENGNNPYYTSTSRQEMLRKCDLSDTLVVDHHRDKIEYDKFARLERIQYKKRKEALRNNEKNRHID